MKNTKGTCKQFVRDNGLKVTILTKNGVNYYAPPETEQLVPVKSWDDLMSKLQEIVDKKSAKKQSLVTLSPAERDATVIRMMNHEQ